MTSVPDDAAQPRTVEEVIRARLTAAVGGWRGSLEAALPTIAFVLVWTLTHRLDPALLAAGVVLVVALALRLVQRSTVRYVASAIFATALAAFIAHRSHNASNVFLPGILQAGAMLVLSVLSIVVRWPLIGFIAAAGDPEMAQDPTAWRRSAGMVRVCSRLTWVFAGMFALRLAVMVPLYLAHDVTALGIAKIALGWPLYIAALALMAWMLVRGHTPLAHHDALLHEYPEAPPPDAR